MKFSFLGLTSRCLIGNQPQSPSANFLVILHLVRMEITIMYGSKIIISYFHENFFCYATCRRVRLYKNTQYC